MGIPKFFRWLCERYPCLCDNLKEYQIPEFDNLYLDMNGIIHICSHPDDGDPHFRITEEQIFTDIFHYIEVLFRIIQPKKLFFMAVDGVAPRAKMNQQRGRRFSSAKEAECSEKKAIEKGETLPSEKRFDSNCITPGTEFMAKLQEQLKYFVTKKVSTDRLWQKPTIILSGHSVPGEGEHKIMDYIRYLRSQSDWDPSTRHCLYGLDADLIILGMCTHESNFTLLREEVTYNKSSKRNSTPETTNYCLLYLNLLRDYLDLEYQELKDKLPFPFQIDSIIDDWVLMGFLMGNDFIPHLPHLHISNNGLSIIYDTYKEVLPTLDGYINEAGILNLSRFEKFLQKLAQFDFDHFNDTYADMKYFESKTGRSMTNNFGTKTGQQKQDDGLQELIDSSNLEMFDFGEDEIVEELLEDGIDVKDSSQGTFHKEFSLHKRDYYINKMEYPTVSTQVLKKEAEGYVIALQWILHYYYRGCPSWGWYYPHHYSPYISDLHSFSSLDIKFDAGTPFLPFQQLLAVLPAASKEFLPRAFQQLMTSESSPIIDYYPPDFEVDLNGKKRAWEGVVLIPFIEEKRLLDAMSPHYSTLTEEEIRRNSHGPMHIYNYTQESLGPYTAPAYFPTITNNHAKVNEIFPDELALPVEKIVCGTHPNAKSNTSMVYRQGFPTLNRIPYRGFLDKKGVKVFEHISRGENMILEVKERENLEEEVVNALLNEKNIYISWPHLMPAKIQKIVTSEFVIKAGVANRPPSSQTEDIPLPLTLPKEVTPISVSDSQELKRNCTSLSLSYMNRYGIDLGDLDTIVWVWPLEGTKVKFNSNGVPSVEMVWSKHALYHPLNTIVLNIERDERDIVKFNCLKEYFEPGTRVFQLGYMYYGYQAKVLGIEKSAVKMELTHTSEPHLKDVYVHMVNTKREYLPGHVAANMLGISSFLLSRITGAIFVQSPHTDFDRMNIGLAMKFNKTNQECVGFTKKEGTMWYYSDQAIDLVRSYIDKFPELFEYLSANTNEDIFFKDKIYSNDEKGAEKWSELKTWLKSLEKGEKRIFGGELLEPSSIALLEEKLSNYVEVPLKLVTIKLKPSYLYVPKADVDMTCPDPEAEFKLLDRVVYVRECHSIPLGTKGIIVGIEKKTSKENTNDNSAWLYDIFFDCEVIGGFAIQGSSKKNCYRLTKHVLINISHGLRTHKNEFVGPKPENINSLNKHLKQSVNMAMPAFSRERPLDTTGSVSNFFKAYNKKSSGNEGGSGGGAPIRPPGMMSTVPPPAAVGPNNPPMPHHVPPPRMMMQPPGVPTILQRPPAVNNQDFSVVWNMLKKNSGTTSAGATPEDGSIIKSQIFTPSKPQFLDRPSQDINPVVNEQTEALKKILRLGPDTNNQSQITNTLGDQANLGSTSSALFENRSCGHASCCAELMALCRSKGVPYPAYSFHPDASGRVTCKLTFQDGAQIIGKNSVDNSRASASAACIAIDSIRNYNVNNAIPNVIFPSRGFNDSWRGNTSLSANEGWRSGSRFMNPPGIPNNQPQYTQTEAGKTEENWRTRSNQPETTQPNAMQNSNNQIASSTPQQQRYNKKGRVRPKIAAKFQTPLNK